MDKPVSAFHIPTFDAAERERIRVALNRYRESHKLGVPTLRQRISLATGRTRNDPDGKDPYLIDQKTLQRFLKDSHRTNDAFLIPLSQFVATLPACPATDRIGPTLAAFFETSGDAPTKIPDDPKHLIGEYEIYGPRTLYPDPSAPEGPLRWRGRTPPSGTAKFSSGNGELHLNIREREYVDGPASAGESGTRMTSDGSLVVFGSIIYAVLRNRLTGLPKTYYLRQTLQGTLAGTVIETTVRRDTDSYYTYAASDDYLFRRIEDQPL